MADCQVMNKIAIEAGISVANIVPCDPEKMRQATEDILHELGIYPKTKKLSLTVYALARAIASEAGDTATPEEAVAIGEASLNRVKILGGTIESHLMKDGKYFGRQRGSNPAVSTSHDPTIENIIAAEMVASGMTKDFVKGATNWFSPRYIKDPLTLFDSWTGSQEGRPQMAWIGHLPAIDVKRFLFLRYAPSLYKSGVGARSWERQYIAARNILEGKKPTSLACPRTTCDDEDAQRVAALVGLGTYVVAVVASFVVASVRGAFA